MPRCALGTKFRYHDISLDQSRAMFWGAHIVLCSSLAEGNIVWKNQKDEGVDQRQLAELELEVRRGLGIRTK